MGKKNERLHPWKLTYPLKNDGWFRCSSYWNSLFLGDMLVFRGVTWWGIPPKVSNYIHIPETNSTRNLKMDAWNTTFLFRTCLFFRGKVSMAYFSGANFLSVSGRVTRFVWPRWIPSFHHHSPHCGYFLATPTPKQYLQQVGPGIGPMLCTIFIQKTPKEIIISLKLITNSKNTLKNGGKLLGYLGQPTTVLLGAILA